MPSLFEMYRKNFLRHVVSFYSVLCWLLLTYCRNSFFCALRLRYHQIILNICVCVLYYCRMLTNSWISCWMSLLTFLRKSLMWQKHPRKRHLCREMLWMVQTVFKTTESRKSLLLHGCTKVFRWVFITHSSSIIIILVWHPLI